MLFTNKKLNSIPDLTLHLYGECIEKVNKTKFLGVIVDQKLSFSHHIDYIKKKIAKNIGIISKTRNYFDTSTLITLYYTFIYPYLTYCIEVWGSAASTHINSLLILQKRVCRIITFSHWHEHTPPIFKELKLLTINDIYTLSLAMFMFRFINRLLPSIFNDYFTLNTTRHSRNTRQRNSYHIPLCRLSTTQKFIKYRCVNLWNSLENSVKNHNSLSSFKKAIKSNLILKY